MMEQGGMIDPARLSCVSFGTSAFRAEVFLFWDFDMVFHVG